MIYFGAMDSPREWHLVQSLSTDPGRQGDLLADLPDDIPSLCRVAQGLTLDVFRAERYGVNLPEKRREEVELRHPAWSNSDSGRRPRRPMRCGQHQSGTKVVDEA